MNKKIIYYFTIFIIIAFGIYLRFRYYLFKPPFWCDEILYGLSFIVRNFINIFTSLEENQMAPPLFSFLILIIRKIFGFNEYSLRLIPFVFGILSEFVFYFVLKEFIKNKAGIIMGLFLFSVCPPLIYYCGEFKPYSTDVFICLILLLLYKKVNLNFNDNKYIIIYTVITMLLVNFSFSVIFIIPAIILSKYINKEIFNYKAIWIIGGLVLSCGILFLTNMTTYKFMFDFWTRYKGFLLFNLKSPFIIINNFLEFWVQHHVNPYLFIMLILLGSICFFFEKKKENLVLFFIIFNIIIASFLKIYPSSERLVLFLIPICIIIICKITDYAYYFKSHTKIYSIIIFIILSILNYQALYLKYLNTNLDKDIMTNERWILTDRISVKNTSEYILKNYEPEEDIISLYEFYTSIEYYASLDKLNINYMHYIIPQKINCFDNLSTKQEIEKLFLNFLKNNSKGLWVIGRLDNSFTTRLSPDIQFIENELMKNKSKYIKILEGNIYIFHIKKN